METRRLLEEVVAERLPEDAPGPRTLGYRELLAHLRGEISLDSARDLIALKTRQLAKRQETWFRLTPGCTGAISRGRKISRAQRGSSKIPAWTRLAAGPSLGFVNHV